MWHQWVGNMERPLVILSLWWNSSKYQMLGPRLRLLCWPGLEPIINLRFARYGWYAITCRVIYGINTFCQNVCFLFKILCSVNNTSTFLIFFFHRYYPHGHTVFWKRLTQISGFWLVEMDISTNHMPKVWVICFQNTGPLMMIIRPIKEMYFYSNFVIISDSVWWGFDFNTNMRSLRHRLFCSLKQTIFMGNINVPVVCQNELWLFFNDYYQLISINNDKMCNNTINICFPALQVFVPMTMALIYMT